MQQKSRHKEEEEEDGDEEDEEELFRSIDSLHRIPPVLSQLTSGRNNHISFPY